jgi:hypothetical protein
VPFFSYGANANVGQPDDDSVFLTGAYALRRGREKRDSVKLIAKKVFINKHENK